MKLRLRPKEKPFVNGRYLYNPVIDEGHLESLRMARSEIVTHMNSGERVGPEALMVGIRMRATLARMLRNERMLLIKHRRKNK